MGVRRSEELSSGMLLSVQHALDRLSDIWEALGIQEERRMERLETVQQHIDELMDSMIREEEAAQECIEQGITIQREELQVLCRELGVDEPAFEPDLRLLQQDKMLRLALEELQRQRKERLEALHHLQRQDLQLCVQLCATPYYVPSGTVPSKLQLQELEEQLDARKHERSCRAQVTAELLAGISLLRWEIGEDTESSLLEDGDEEDLSPARLQTMRDLLQRLRDRRDALCSAQDKVKQQVDTLWERLKVCLSDRSLLQAGPGGLSRQLHLWENELERLQKLKLAQLEQVTVAARSELQLYWDKCFFSQEQREAFAPFYSAHFTEELLSQHDQEVVRVKAQYERSRSLLEAAGRWELTWARFMELETKASDPNRFANRGGALLKEEKERARVQKQLSRLEEELRRDTDAWEAEQGTGFVLKGQRLQDYVATHWERLKQHRELEKQQRSQHKAEGAPVKVSLKRTAPGSAPGPATKTRKAIVTPSREIYVLGCHN